MVLVVKNLPANAGDIRDMGSIPGWERSPGEGHGNLLQYSCLENPMDRGAWWATDHGVTRVVHDLATKPTATSRMGRETLMFGEFFFFFQFQETQFLESHKPLK